MTRNEQLAFCKICTHQKFDPKQGIVCGLTGIIADFEGTCSNFEKDEKYIEKQNKKRLERGILANLATTTDRFLNRLVDYIVIILVSVFIGIILGVILTLVDPSLIEVIENGGILFNYITGFIITIMYYTFFEAIFGQSVGKFLTKTKVVDEKGNKATFSAIFTRSLCRCIPFNAFSFLGDKPTGWHDTLSKTNVVKIVKED